MTQTPGPLMNTLPADQYIHIYIYIYEFQTIIFPIIIYHIDILFHPIIQLQTSVKNTEGLPMT